MPPFSFCRMVLSSWTSLAPPWSQSQGNPTDAIPFSPNCIARVRYFRSAHNQYPNVHLLPLYVNGSSFEIETLRSHPKNSSNLSKICIGLAFQAALAKFFQTSPSGPSPDRSPFFGLTMVIAFAAALSGNFLSHSKPRLAAIVEKTGCISTAMGFLLMTTRVFLSGSLVMWIIGWLAGAFTMLAFVVSCLT